ncbi:phytoene desaturase family protein [Leptolyngbya sp. NIES-2104]|uniref:phytoene desaturase family protein n=1 Tax=Leptolyngbya sp. NIES-2104 TaxID=1552121 RepID=UPI0006EC4D2C|nr:NAD(P)/FAD-dependent oxidoreductase [Leptolyngbya sp. NIES-2104]GAP98741.1 phytoene dehydrogenase and related proteins [Leptolyngbya sp. NIES-2104]
MMQNADVIVIGSGIGGLVAGALLARYGKSVMVCESHTIPGGAVHSFSRQGFHFDSGASFYCGLSDPNSVNPLRQVLDVLGETVEAVRYDPFGHYHFPDATLPVYGNLEKYRSTISQISPQGAIELIELEKRFLSLYEGLRGIPTLALRADWKLAPILISRYLPSLLKLLPNLGMIQASVGDLMDQTVRDPWVRRLLDLECFLLSGLKAHGTIAPEVAFMFGERTRSIIDYPIGGSGAIVDALVRGLKKWGGTLRLGTHVEKILIESGRVRGVRLRNGEELAASIVISNATIWDTYTQLLEPNDLPNAYRQTALKTPAIDSFMHLHLGIRADGLEHLTGHHVVVHDDRDITVPGNTCMISIPSVWDANLAPEGHHVIHAYTLEPFEGWARDSGYEEKKKERSQSLFRAVEKVIPDLCDRIVLELIGTPLTHARYLRRYQGTYGAGIPAGQGLFPSCHTPIQNLYRVGDSTMPGIGVPAVAASGILCANTIVDPNQHLNYLFCKAD